MFDRMGILDDLVATGIKSTSMRLMSRGSQLAQVKFGGVDSAFPYSLLTAQTETERVLTDRLGRLGVAIERGVEVVGLEQDNDRAHLTLRRSDGSTESVTASYVIAADGAHSTMRHLLGVELHGTFHGERFILGDCDAEHHMDPESMYTVFSPAGTVVMMPMRAGRARLMAQLHDAPGAPVNPHPTQEALQQILDERVGGVTITDSHWLTCFEIHHGQVARYRHGRVFLTGDAAHIHSPAGGQGMNTGMQDAFNLAWKLAAVVHGDGGQVLLDSYHAERHPVAEAVIAFSGNLTRAGTVRGGAQVVRNAIVRVLANVPAVSAKMASVVEEVDIGYQDSPIVMSTMRRARIHAGGHLPHIGDPDIQKQLARLCGGDNAGHTVLTVTADRPAPAAGPAGQVQVLIAADDTPVGGYDAVVTDPRGLVTERYGVRDGARVVVRPDGYVGAVAELDDRGAVTDYFARIAR